MNDKLIPREYYKTFVLGGKAHFIAHCAITANHIRFFVRKQKTSDMYNVYIWKSNEGWLHVASYFDNTCMLHVYTESKQYRNAIRAVFNFSKSPSWLTITHLNHCAKCGRYAEHLYNGFGKECSKKIFEQLKWRYKNESN